MTPLTATEWQRAREQFHGEVNALVGNWGVCLGLFAQGPAQITALNDKAGRFFGLFQQLLLRDVILSIARLTDGAATARQENLSLRALLEDPAVRDVPALKQAVAAAVSTAATIALHRHKYIAHLDRAVAAGLVLPALTRSEIDTAIAAIRNAFATYFLDVERQPLLIVDEAESIVRPLLLCLMREDPPGAP